MGCNADYYDAKNNINKKNSNKLNMWLSASILCTQTNYIISNLPTDDNKAA